MTQAQEPPLKALGLRERHVELGVRFGAFAGWEMPLWYGGALEEHNAVRHEWGVFDISHMGRLQVSGPDAAAALGGLFTRDPSSLVVGASAYALACNGRGGIIDDLIVYRREADAYLVVCNAANAAAIRAITQAALQGREARLSDLQAEDSVLLAVQGPHAVAGLAEIVGRGLLEIGRHGCGSLEWRGAAFFLARTGYTGEDGYEVLCAEDAGGQLLEALVEAGCRPAGLAARDSLRLEASLALHGHEIDQSTTPWEAGLGWAVDLEHDFHGREALLATKDATKRRLTSLVADGSGVIRAGFPIRHEGEDAGTVASGGFSPMLKTSIAMAYLPRRLSKPDTRLSVDLRGRDLACHTVRRPFYRGSASAAE